MPIPPGTRLGPYEIRSPLGSGGMSEVYRAHDKRLRRDVAGEIARALEEAYRWMWRRWCASACCCGGCA